MTLFQRETTAADDAGAAAPAPGDAAYQRHKARAAARQADQSKNARDIGEIPPPADPARRARAEGELAWGLRTYFPAAFPLDWSDDHRRVIAKIEHVLRDRALHAMAMPRGSGKTTLCERAILLAALYGWHPFCMLIGAEKDKAEESMGKIQLELEANELLLADFPEVCVPIRALERIANRARGQTYQGQPTRMQWKSNLIVFPTIPGSVSSGTVLKTGSLLSAVRGANFSLPDGKVIRPTAVLLDDPQTRRSAASESQSRTRAKIVAADVLGLAGPGQRISAMMPCTVIEKGDMADQILDRAQHPEWQGERTKLVNRFPKNMARWEEYRELVADKLARDAKPEEVRKAANAFYRKHRAEMDEGAEVAWEQRIDPGDLSALQTAMNLYFRDPEAFASEYQNEPIADDADADELQTADQLARRVNALARGRVPLRAQRLTAFIDVHDKLLFWMVCWWDDDFTGGVLDYGAFPDQGNTQFTLRAAKPTLQKATGLKTVLPAIKKGLMTLIADIAGRSYARDDGVELKVERLLVDANYGYSTDTVYEACRESEFSSLCRPAHGRGIKPQQKAMSEWPVKQGEKAGHHWFRKTGKRAQRFLLVDTNYWKTYAHDALTLAPEEPHSLSLFKAPAHVHRLLAAHLTAEVRTRARVGSRVVDLWDVKPAKPDNHWFDCLVGCCVGASEQGCKLSKVSRLAKPKDEQKPAARRRKSVEILEW